MTEKGNPARTLQRPGGHSESITPTTMEDFCAQFIPNVEECQGCLLTDAEADYNRKIHGLILAEIGRESTYALTVDEAQRVLQKLTDAGIDLMDFASTIKKQAVTPHFVVSRDRILTSDGKSIPIADVASVGDLQGYRYIQTSDALILWELNGIVHSLLHQRTSKPVFLPMLQNQFVNVLPRYSPRRFAKELGYVGDGDTATLTLSSGVELSIENFRAVNRGIAPTTACMLLDAILIAYTESRAMTVEIPLAEYARLRGVSDTKELRKQVTRDLQFLQRISFRGNAKSGSQKAWTGTILLNGGTAIIHNGVIRWNFNSDFRKNLEALAPLDYAAESLQLDPAGNQYAISRYLDSNYRLNEGKERVSIIRVATLLDVAPNIPSYEDVKSKDRAYRKWIIAPLLRDLRSIPRIKFTIRNAAGETVADPDNMPISEFLKSTVVVDYSAYPKHSDRVRKRRKSSE